MSELPEPPIRLCCGQRHYGVQCPDGMVMCCLCFGRFTVDQLNCTLEGIAEDVCCGCAEHEQAEIERRRHE